MLRASLFALLATSVLLLAGAPATQATNLIACTVGLAEDQYYSTGDYVFGHGQLNQYGGDTSGNVGTFAACGPQPDIECESEYATAQSGSTFAYLGHGQLKVFGGETTDNAALYVYCKGFT